MTASEHLAKIESKCRENIALAKNLSVKWAAHTEYLVDLRQAIAGWLSTLAAIDALKEISRRSSLWTNHADAALDDIRAAWPEELL